MCLHLCSSVLVYVFVCCCDIFDGDCNHLCLWVMRVHVWLRSFVLLLRVLFSACIFLSRRWYISHTEKLLLERKAETIAADAKAAAKTKAKAKAVCKVAAVAAAGSAVADVGVGDAATAGASQASGATPSALVEPPCKKQKVGSPPPLASSSASSSTSSAPGALAASLGLVAHTATAIAKPAEASKTALPFVVGPHLFTRKEGADLFHEYLLIRYPKIWEAAFNIPLVGKNNVTCWHPKLVAPSAWEPIAAKVTCYLWGIDPSLNAATDKKFPNRLWQKYSEELMPTPTRNYKLILEKFYDYAEKAPHGVPHHLIGLPMLVAVIEDGFFEAGFRPNSRIVKRSSERPCD